MNSYLSYGTCYQPHLGPTDPDSSAATSGRFGNLLYKENYAWKIHQVKNSAEKIIVYEQDEHTIRDGRGQLQSPYAKPGTPNNPKNAIGMLAIRHDAKRVDPDDCSGN